MIPPSQRLDPNDPELGSQIAQIPNCRGIYRLTPETGIPYLGWSDYLSKRLARLLLNTNQTSNLLTNLRNRLRKVEYWLTGSRLESSLLLYYLSVSHDPDGYRRRLKLRPAWFVTLLLGDTFPRLSVRNKIARHPNRSYGPFRNRETAETFQKGIETLFQVRRCTESLAPAEDHPGCIYGEMNLCLRPCQLAVSVEEYGTEVNRVRDFLDTRGKHSLHVLMTSRDRASENTEFEEAAMLHKELEKVKSVLTFQDEIVTEVDSLNGVALTKGANDRTVVLWPMVSGCWHPPLRLEFPGQQLETRSLDQFLREKLTHHIAPATRPANRVDEIAVLARWYYSSRRDGEWFAFHDISDLNLRKLVRNISKLLRDDLQS
jgi:excinuclease ABC subunit C